MLVLPIFPTESAAKLITSQNQAKIKAVNLNKKQQKLYILFLYTYRKLLYIYKKSN